MDVCSVSMGAQDVSIAGLRIVQQAAALGSFSAAAEALGYTQPAISRQIAAVETAFGAPLFDRIPRGVRPTEAGTVLVEHATAVLATLEAADTAIARIRERLAGRLVLGSIPVAMSVLVPRAIARLSQVNPDLDISLHEAPTPVLIERVRHDLLDLAVIALGADLPQYDLEDLRRDVLLVDTLRVAVPANHRLARRERVTVSDLRNEPWIVGQAVGDEPVFGVWPTLPDAPVAYASREWPARLGMVAAGLGIALMPHVGAASVPAGVAVIDVDDPAQRARSAVALTPADPTAAARAMVTALRTEAAQVALSRPRQ
jgi:DNA-binding transcriptional LysR family regulator